MSGYSGGVAIVSAGNFNRNPNTMRKLLTAPDGLGLFQAAGNTTPITDQTGEASFYSEVARGDGAFSRTMAVNISAGVTLLSTTGKGFLGAIVLPIFATATGNIVITINIDGTPTVFTMPCLSSHKYVFLPYKIEGENEGFGNTVSPAGAYAINYNTTRIYDISKYIADNKALRFEQSLSVSISSPTALLSQAGYNAFAVQCLKDRGL